MTKEVDLGGAWSLRWNDGQRGDRLPRALGVHADTMPAIAGQVPGSVHLDLVRAGLLAEPTVGLNCLAARWVEETIWYYRRTFTAPALRDGERAHLIFECLDLVAVVSLNGREVGRHANAFYPCRIDVTDALRSGENTVVVQVEAGLFENADRPGKGFGMHQDSELGKRNWARTTQSSFGWDWSPRLLNVGIRGRARLEIHRETRVEGFVALSELSPDLTMGRVAGRLFVEGLGAQPVEGQLEVEIVGTGRRETTRVSILPGLHPYETLVNIESPEPWWPVGHGKQKLFTVRASLTVEGRAVGAWDRRVGFRAVRVNQQPHPSGGHFFVLEINGKPIFVKGGNFVPADPILARLDRARYATLVDRALEANCNMLRIWGGGLYESDDFYEICDERGVLVWQESIFACAKYPAFDERFLADVGREATWQVRRLAHHPSLVVWCGNNEMEWGAHDWGYEKGVAYPDYAIFHLLLPRTLKKEDGTRYYQPSSPFSPDCEPPNRDDMGDQHPWSIGFANTDFREYRRMTCRFPNEGGILGPTALPTVRACLPPGHEHPRSFSWEQHDNSVYSWGETSYPDDMLQRWLGKSLESMSIEVYVYWAGVVQGEGLTEYIRNFRRRMFDSASAIFWMYNDCWPAVRSWTIVDYYLRRTPAFHPVRRAFRPLCVALVVQDDSVVVYGVNEGPAWRGELHWGFFALAGGRPVEERRTVELGANASTWIGALPLSRWSALGEATHGAFALLSRDGREAARDRLFLPLYKDMAWPTPDVKVQRQGDTAIFSSNAFAWRVCLDLDGELPLSDNFFDVFPGIPTVLDWPDSLGEPAVVRVGRL